MFPEAEVRFKDIKHIFRFKDILTLIFQTNSAGLAMCR